MDQEIVGATEVAVADARYLLLLVDRLCTCARANASENAVSEHERAELSRFELEAILVLVATALPTLDARQDAPESAMSGLIDRLVEVLARSGEVSRRLRSELQWSIESANRAAGSDVLDPALGSTSQ